MAKGIRTGDPCGFNKGCSLKFRVGSQVRQTPEKGRRKYQLKCSGNNNKDKDNSPKILYDKNHTADVENIFKLKCIWDRGQVLFLKYSFQDKVFDSPYFKCFTAVVDDFFPEWFIFHHLLLCSISPLSTLSVFDDICKMFLRFMSWCYIAIMKDLHG